jgi:hypothetical protein
VVLGEFLRFLDGFRLAAVDDRLPDLDGLSAVVEVESELLIDVNAPGIGSSRSALRQLSRKLLTIGVLFSMCSVMAHALRISTIR